MQTRVRRYRIVLLATCFFVSAAATWAEERLPAVWKDRELTFEYVGFTSRYTCEGLRDRIQEALTELGARRDLVVTPYPCSRAGLPEFAPSVRIKAATLVPAAQDSAPGSVQGRWKTVRLAGTGMLGSSDCELLEQIRSQILPLFTTRNLKSDSTCIPHQQPAGNVVLMVDVLVPVTD